MCCGSYQANEGRQGQFCLVVGENCLLLHSILHSSALSPHKPRDNGLQARQNHRALRHQGKEQPNERVSMQNKAMTQLDYSHRNHHPEHSCTQEKYTEFIKSDYKSDTLSFCLFILYMN